MLMLASLYPLKRFSQLGRPLTPSLLGRHILYNHFYNRYFILLCLLLLRKGFVTKKVLVVIHLCLLTVQDKQGAMGLKKPTVRLNLDVDDLLYLMTLTIPQLFLKPLQVLCDATVFRLFNEDFPLYIKHEDLFEIPHDGQCLNIFVIQLRIL